MQSDQGCMSNLEKHGQTQNISKSWNVFGVWWPESQVPAAAEANISMPAASTYAVEPSMDDINLNEASFAAFLLP